METLYTQPAKERLEAKNQQFVHKVLDRFEFDLGSSYSFLDQYRELNPKLSYASNIQLPAVVEFIDQNIKVDYPDENKMVNKPGFMRQILDFKQSEDILVDDSSEVQIDTITSYENRQANSYDLQSQQNQKEVIQEKEKLKQEMLELAAKNVNFVNEQQDEVAKQQDLDFLDSVLDFN
ncbi:UNKNOWN [Stylonychia lemnae]|uniref:Uncharacterized protein n=1 Tax=Stylonychia lemnae TaxID=5949 RepID=A0A078AFF4_STYLE|nr:UNKNOWN [Stylonychia lemnae]|eukprot:CDW80257.1 UNKNOWN [Stylonychia lemnae]